MKNIFVWLYESTISGMVLRYKLRVRLVPVSYKIYLVSIGVAIGVSYSIAVPLYRDMMADNSIVIENNALADDPVIPQIDDIEWMDAIFTGYSAGDGYTPGVIMASGKKVYIGAVACPRDMDLGTVIELSTGERYTCEDRKALRFDGEFDIYFDSVSNALQFGRKSLKYRII